MVMNCTNHSAVLATGFPTRAAPTPPAQDFLGAPASRPSRRRIRAGLGRRWRSLLDTFEQRRERARIRRVLAALDDRLLHDIGLSRADVGPALPAPFPGLCEPLASDHAAARGRGFSPARHGLWHL
jgi:uncharacterized protein YjiS (DUF1127 family)